MRQLTLRSRKQPPLEAEGLAFLAQLPGTVALTPAQARFMVHAARQYTQQGLSWQELIEAGCQGAQRASAQAPGQVDRFWAWWVRQAMLQAIAATEKGVAADLGSS